jgi:hypothetical protein
MASKLFAYRGLTLPEARARILELADRCGVVEGAFTLLWHNTSLGPGGEARARMYADTAADLAAATTD